MAQTATPPPNPVRKPWFRYWRMAPSSTIIATVWTAATACPTLIRIADEVSAAPPRASRGSDRAHPVDRDGGLRRHRRLPCIRRLLHDPDHCIDRRLRRGPSAEPCRPHLQFVPDLLWRHDHVFRHRGHDAEHYRAGIGRILWKAASQTHDRQAGEALHHLRLR